MTKPSELSSKLKSLKVDADARNTRMPNSERSFLTFIAGGIFGFAAAIGIVTLLQQLNSNPGAKARAENTPPASQQIAKTAADRTASAFSAAGFVVARRKATVAAQITGQIIAIEVDEGEFVEAGQTIARLRADAARVEVRRLEATLRAAEADVNRIEAELREAGATLLRTRRLSDDNFAAASVLERDLERVQTLKARKRQMAANVDAVKLQIAAAKINLDRHFIRAPFSGVVVEKNANEGEIISPVSAGGGFTRTGICTLVDMDSLEIEVDVNESYISRVAIGEKVRAVLEASPNESISGTVVAKLSTADRAKATVRVRISINEMTDRILPEMAVRVFFDAPSARLRAAEPVTPR